MNRREKLKRIIENRNKIIEGLANTIFKKDFVEDVSRYRYEICSKCKYKSEKCIVPGECCSICGCNLKMKTRSLSSHCALDEKGEKPKWKAVLNEQAEVDFNLLDI
jgi:hypothetical protein